MKVTKRYIKQLVKEELTLVLKEMDDMRRAQISYDAQLPPDYSEDRDELPDLEKLWDEEILNQHLFSEFVDEDEESGDDIVYEPYSLTFEELSKDPEHKELYKLAQEYYKERGEEDFENHLAR